VIQDNQNILVGTAAWADPSLIACGRFYPEDATSPEARLRHYATVFPMVEVDSSYYRLPSAANAQRWAERTPDDFVFNIKAFRLFTGHPTAADALPPDVAAALPMPLREPGRLFRYADVPPDLCHELWRRYVDAVAPLRAAGKLGAVHLQFSPTLSFGAGARDHVAHCAAMLEGHRMAVEWRHQSWLAPGNLDATLAFERALGLAHVVADTPQGFANSVPPTWEVANPQLSVVRLHGRNTATWNAPPTRRSTGRFDYDYPAAELQAMVPRIRDLARRSRMVQVVFNNNNEDQGQRNGRTLMKLLGF